MEPESSLPYSQEPATPPYPQSIKSNLHTINFLGILSFGFSTEDEAISLFVCTQYRSKVMCKQCKNQPFSTALSFTYIWTHYLERDERQQLFTMAKYKIYPFHSVLQFRLFTSRKQGSSKYVLFLRFVDGTYSSYVPHHSLTWREWLHLLVKMCSFKSN
jgi:hypothetical protein